MISTSALHICLHLWAHVFTHTHTCPASSHTHTKWIKIKIMPYLTLQSRVVKEFLFSEHNSNSPAAQFHWLSMIWTSGTCPVNTHPASTLPYINAMLSLPSILLYSFREIFECCQVQNVLLRDTFASWAKSRSLKATHNSFISWLVYKPRKPLGSWVPQMITGKKAKAKWQIFYSGYTFLLIPGVTRQP